MAIVRLFDFTPNTVIASAQVDAEFNQLVNLLNGTTTNIDTILRFAGTNPVLILDQVGTGLIQSFRAGGVAQGSIDRFGTQLIHKIIASLNLQPTSPGLAAGFYDGNITPVLGVNRVVDIGSATSGYAPLVLYSTNATGNIQRWFGVNNLEACRVTNTGRLLLNASQAAVSLSSWSSASIVPGGIINNIIPDTIQNSGSGETTLGIYTLPANTCANNNDIIEFTYWGIYNSNANSKTLRAKFNSNNIVSITRTTSGGSWKIVGSMVRVNSSFLRYMWEYSEDGGSTNARFNAEGVLSLQDFSVDNTISFTGQASSTSDILANQGYLKKFTAS